MAVATEDARAHEPASIGKATRAHDGRLKLAVDAVSMRFGSHLVLSDLNLKIREGEFVSIIGASGCGKTTFLNLVAGFLQPSSGRILSGDSFVQHPGPDRSMIFQDDAVFPWYTTAQNIGYGLRYKKLTKEERQRRVAELVDLVGLRGREDSYPLHLSGGMRKRIDIAGALAVEPEVLLMDEPFASLDVITKMVLQQEFLRIWETNRMTVVFVTHDIEEALFLSDRVLLMSLEPGRFIREERVPFERPRSESVRTSAELQALRGTLQAELERSMRLSGGETDPRDEEATDGSVGLPRSVGGGSGQEN